MKRLLPALLAVFLVFNGGLFGESPLIGGRSPNDPVRMRDVYRRWIGGLTGICRTNTTDNNFRKRVVI